MGHMPDFVPVLIFALARHNISPCDGHGPLGLQGSRADLGYVSEEPPDISLGYWRD